VPRQEKGKNQAYLATKGTYWKTERDQRRIAQAEKRSSART
jgi:hypothetical protein